MAEPQKPVTDLSPRVVSLARMLDRLPPGNYTVQLEKPEVKGMAWHAEVTRTETIINVTIDRGGE